jgi:hypothetical protein
MTYQTAEREMTEPKLKEIEFISKALIDFKAPGENEIIQSYLNWPEKCDRNISPSKRYVEQRMYA